VKEWNLPTRLASNEIFSASNKIHREVSRAKDLTAPLYLATGTNRETYHCAVFLSFLFSNTQILCRFLNWRGQHISRQEANDFELSGTSSRDLQKEFCSKFLHEFGFNLSVLCPDTSNWTWTHCSRYLLTVFMNRVLRMIGPKRDELTGEWRRF